MAITENELLIKITVARTKAAAALKTMTKNFGSFLNKVRESNSVFKFNILTMLKMSAVYLAFRSALRFVISEFKDMVGLTARIELLTNSMEQLAKVNNINVKFLRANVIIMKSMGITTEDSVNVLSKFIRLNLDLTKVTQLVRVAQDLAVISGKSTTETVGKMINGIVTLNARMLRSAGLMFTAKQAAEEWAKANNRTVKSMSVAEKQQAVMNKVLTEGKIVFGLYESSLGLVGKKLLQFDRLWKEAKIALGSFTQEALVVGVDALQKLLKNIVILKKEGTLDLWGKKVSDALKILIGFIISSIEFMWKWRGVILVVIEAFIGFKILATVTGMVIALNKAWILLNTAMAWGLVRGLIPYIQWMGRAIAHFGFFRVALLNTSTALVTFSTILIGLGLGGIIGRFIGGLESLRESFNKLADDAIQFNMLRISGPDFVTPIEKFKKFVNDYVFGWAQISEAEKLAKEATEEDFKLRSELQVKQAKKTIEQLSNQVKAQQGFTDEVIESTKKIKKAFEDLGIITKETFDEKINKAFDSFKLAARSLKEGTVSDFDALKKGLLNKIKEIDEGFKGEKFEGLKVGFEKITERTIKSKEEMKVIMQKALTNIKGDAEATIKALGGTFIKAGNTLKIELGRQKIKTEDIINEMAEVIKTILPEATLTREEKMTNIVKNELTKRVELFSTHTKTVVELFSSHTKIKIDEHIKFINDISKLEIDYTKIIEDQNKLRLRSYKDTFDSIKTMAVSVKRTLVDVQGAFSTTRTTVPSFGGSTVGGSFQQGTSFVPFTGNFKLHKGEAVIPTEQNPFNDNRNQSKRFIFNFSDNSIDDMNIERKIKKAIKRSRIYQ